MVVVAAFTPRTAHNLAKSLLTYCGPLSASINWGTLNGTIKLSRYMFAICVTDGIEVSVAFVNFGKQFFFTTINWLPWLVFSNVQRMSIATNSRRPDAEKS